MNALRTSVLAVLDTIQNLLREEPARLIGYGAAAVVFVVAQVLNARGIFATDLTFEEAVQFAFIALAFVVTVVESIRKFVYSPQTYIEDLADAYGQGHEEAHEEEEIGRFLAAMQAEAEAAQKPQPRATVVGSTKGSNATSGKPD